MPSGWETEPKNITEVIKGGERRDFRFSIIVPDKTISGYYVVRGEFLWDDRLIIKEYGVEVAPFNYLLIGVLISIIVGVGLVIIYIYIKRKEREKRKIYVTGSLKSIRKGIKGGYHETD
jgi:uncharacterized membrane protein